MVKSSENEVTVGQILVPLSLVSFVVMLFFAFQTAQVIRDRDTLHETKGSQEKAFVESEKLRGQLSALVIGTNKLADAGNENAKVIAGKLKEIGVVVEPPAANQVSPANPPVPTSEAERPAPPAKAE